MNVISPGLLDISDAPSERYVPGLSNAYPTTGENCPIRHFSPLYLTTIAVDSQEFTKIAKWHASCVAGTVRSGTMADAT